MPNTDSNPTTVRLNCGATYTIRPGSRSEERLALGNKVQCNCTGTPHYGLMVEIERPSAADTHTITELSILVIGMRVRRTHGRTIGDEGTLVAVHGSIAGDTLVTVRRDDGTTFQPYTRQIAVVR